MYPNRLFSILCGILLSFLANAKENSTGEAVSLPKPGSAFFLENKGQYIDQFHNQRPDIDFRLKTGGVNIFIGEGQVHYQWSKKNSTIRQFDNSTINDHRSQIKNQEIETYRLDVELVGADRNAIAITEEKKDYRENYYLPQCPNGATAYAYGKIIYKNVYPNIDWVLYTSNGQFKYDFIVHEGGNISDIKLKYDGDTLLQLQDGKLFAATPLGNITEDKPYAYDAVTKKQVACNYVINSKTVSFSTGQHDGALIIDPTVDWASYYGGVYSDSVFALATKFGTNVTNCLTYMAGESNSFDLFVTTGAAHAGVLNDGNTDAFIAGFALNGVCTFSTLYGGVNNDGFRALVCDKAGNLYAAGGTSSSTGIAYNGFQNTIGGQQLVFPATFADGFVVKFDTNGIRTWASYFGGERWDVVNSIALDNSGYFYIAGYTFSLTGIATNNGFQKNNGAFTKDGFLAKFNTNGARQWATYYGGDNADNISRVLCDNNGGVYIGGYTLSFDTCNNMRNAIATPGSFKEFHSHTFYTFCDPLMLPIYPQPDNDAFIAKFDSAGNRLWGTYYGGPGDDYIFGMSYDSTKIIDSSGAEINGMLYVSGLTESASGIATSSGFQQSYGGIGDGLIAAFKPDGARYWGSYFGGINRESIEGIFTNQKGSVFITGFTASTTLATADAIKKNLTGATDAFLAVFNGAVRQSCTYYGGSHIDYGTCVTIGNNDKLYLGGNTRSWDSISYNNNGVYNILQPVYGGNPTTSVNDPDAFIAQLTYNQPVTLSFVPPVPPAKPNNRICIGDSAVYSLTVSNNLGNQVFQPGNVFTLQLSDTNGNFGHPYTLATYTSSSMSVNIQAGFPAGIIPGANYNYKLRVISSKPLMISNDYSIIILDYPKPVRATSNSPLCVGDTILLSVIDSLNSGVIYHWNGPDSFSYSFKNAMVAKAGLDAAGDYRLFVFNGYCRISDTTNVVIHSIPGIQTISNNSPICAGDSLKLMVNDTIPGLAFNWTGPAGFNSNLQNPVIDKVSMLGAGKYVVNYTYLGCSNKDSTMVVLKPAPDLPAGSSNSPVCAGDTLKLSADNTVTGVNYIWTGPGGYYAETQKPLIAADLNRAGTYFVRSKLYDCISEPDSVAVVIKPLPPVPFVNSNSPLKEGQDLELTSSTIAGASYRWAGPNGFSSSEQNPVISKAKLSATGNYTLLVTVDGCSSSGIVIVVINEVAQTYFSLYPNPNKGVFTIKVSLERDQVVPFAVVNEAGQVIYAEQVTSNKKLVTHAINLPESSASGVYFLKIRMDGNNRVIPFTVNK